MTKLEKISFIGHLFVYAGRAQWKQEWVVYLAAVVGLNQGLKYKGDFKAGLVGALAVLMTIAAAGGFMNVMDNWEKIKSL